MDDLQLVSLAFGLLGGSLITLVSTLVNMRLAYLERKDKAESDKLDRLEQRRKERIDYLLNVQAQLIEAYSEFSSVGLGNKVSHLNQARIISISLSVGDTKILEKIRTLRSGKYTTDDLIKTCEETIERLGVMIEELQSKSIDS